MKKNFFLFFVCALISAASFGQSKFAKADLSLGATYFNTYRDVYQDTTLAGAGWKYEGGFTYRTAPISFFLSGYYSPMWKDTAAGERWRVNVGVGKSASTDEAAEWIVANEFFVGYQYYSKSDHYALKGSNDTVVARFQKTATTHSVFATEDFYVFRDGSSDEIVKAFSFHKISFSLLYSFKEKLKSSFAGEGIKSSLDPEDNTALFYSMSYKTKVLGIPLGGTTGLGFYGGAGYSNLCPFGKATGLEVSGGIALDNYNSLGNPIEISYSHHFIGGGINSISLKINLASWYYLW